MLLFASFFIQVGKFCVTIRDVSMDQNAVVPKTVRRMAADTKEGRKELQMCNVFELPLIMAILSIKTN